MKLSPNFSLEEMTFSETAARRNLANVPNAQAVDNLRQLCTLVLEPLRERLGQPIIVTSGYRSSAVNAAVGGVPHSDHIQGCAADIRVQGYAPSFLMREVVRLSTGLPLKQAILEYSRWVHVSIDVEAEAPEFLIATGYDGHHTKFTKWVDA